MSKQTILAPSILNADFSSLGEQIKLVENAGASWLHLDVMDGHFVPNISFGPPVLQHIQKITNLPIDVHLMVENPDDFLQNFQQIGAKIVTVHAEVCTHLYRTLERIKSLDMKAGVALNPATPISHIESVIPYVDLILAMTVNPGFGGQAFIPEVLMKIKQIAKMIEDSGKDIFLEADGGIDLDMAKDVVSNGANVLVVGSAIYQSKDISATVKKFLSILA